MLNYLDPTAVVDDELRQRLSDVDDCLTRMSALGNVSVQMKTDRLRLAAELRIAEALERIAEALAPTLRPVVEPDIDPETRAHLSDALRAAEEEVGGNEGEESGPTMEDVLTMGSEFPDDPRGDRPGVDGKD